MAGIDALKQFDQWINYKLEHRADGKTDKIPVSPHTGRVCGAQSPENWASYEQAKATGQPVGFVFTEVDPFFFLDLDDCRKPDGSWDDVANYATNVFAGCAFEISQSGNGLHGFGIMPEATPHGCNSEVLHSQFYTSNRFCAVTEQSVIGDAGFMPDRTIYNQFVNYYFPAGPSTPVGPVFNSGPCPEWSGPADDAELIKKALASQGMGSALGVRASFAQLWAGDPAVLADYFPSERGDFNWSEADAALCGHLAFWTGKDHERIRRLWASSALGQRDKFHDRVGYQDSTISGACHVCSKVYNDGKNKLSDEDLQAYGASILFGQDQVEYFNGCVYVQDAHRVFIPAGVLLKPEQFRATYSGPIFMLDNAGKKSTRNAWTAFIESQAFTAPKVSCACFEPRSEPGSIMEKNGKLCVNTYIPPVIDQADGDTGPFWDLLWRMLPDERDRLILTSYMAAIVQHKGVKFRWSPVLQGIPGNGKSTITNILEYCVGFEHTYRVKPRDIMSDFDAWMMNKIFIAANEMTDVGNKNVIECLKESITETRVSVQAKGRDQVTIDSCANFFFCMNSKSAIKKSKTDRRFCIFYTAQQEKGDLERDGLSGDYFYRFYSWLESGGYSYMCKFLGCYQIPDQYNPAGICNRAPETSSTATAILESRSAAAQCLADTIEDGRPGFYNGWVSSTMALRILKDDGYRVVPNRLNKVMAELNYIPHPGLPEGKSTRLIPNEGTRPRLYVTDNHYSIECQNPVEDYCRDQGYQELI